MRTYGWIPLSERKPTQEEVDRGVWWTKPDWKKPAWRVHGGHGNLPRYEESWLWRPDPLPPEPPARQMPEWESEFNQWKREVEADKVNPGIIDSWYGGWIRREIIMNEEAAKLRRDVSARDKRLSELIESNTNVIIQRDKLSHENAELRRKLEAANEVESQLSWLCSKHSATISERNQKIEQLQSQIKVCHQAMGERDKELSELKKYRDETVALYVARGVRMDELEAEIKNLKEARDRWKTAYLKLYYDHPNAKPACMACGGKGVILDGGMHHGKPIDVVCPCQEQPKIKSDK